MKRVLHKGLMSCHVQLRVISAFGDCVPDGFRSGHFPEIFFAGAVVEGLGAQNHVSCR